MARKEIGRARRLRRDMTDAERKFWSVVRNRGFNGVKFRRQAPIAQYIVDFVCMEARLIVELDGGQHADNAEADAIRTKDLEAAGYRVIRFSNNDVMRNLEGVLETIGAELSRET